MGPVTRPLVPAGRPAQVMEYLTDSDTTIDEFGAGCFDVEDDLMQTLH
jgi:hypothetical protein